MLAKLFLSFLLLFQGLPYIQPIVKTRLMIVAHPDDEAIFGGNEISKYPYYIICLTNGDNPKRKAEFEAMLKQTNNKGIILSYPDNVNGKRSNWEDDVDDIAKTLEIYLTLLPWQKIVTHNPSGEYGHQHHKMTSEIIREITLQNHLENQLYCFSYFKRKEQPSVDMQLSKDEHEKKVKLLEVYQSQSKTVHKFDHFIDYEKIVPYPFKKGVYEYKKIEIPTNRYSKN